MELVSLLVAGVVFALIAAPAILLLTTFLLLVPMALLAPAAPVLARTSFVCPVSRHDVTATFLTEPGAAAPTDVVACSTFPNGVRCAKSCLGEAHASWTPSPVIARYALLAGGEARREAS